MNVQGTIVSILPDQTGVSKAGKEWSKKEFVIETDDQFPKNIAFTLFGDKIGLLNGKKQGDKVDVHFNLESREFNGKWFHNINAWKIDEGEAEEEYTPPTPEINPSDDFGNDNVDESNDLPF